QAGERRKLGHRQQLLAHVGNVDRIGVAARIALFSLLGRIGFQVGGNRRGDLIVRRRRPRFATLALLALRAALTLFSIRGRIGGEVFGYGLGDLFVRRAGARVALFATLALRSTLADGTGRTLRARPRRASLDRNSTRLHSSHGKISYAVSSLK